MANAKKPTKKTSSSKAKKSEAEIPSAPPVMDVSKPGETAASPTSRPVIVGHRAMLKKDPMVADNEDKKDELTLSSKKGHTIQPPNDTEAAAKSTDEDSTVAEKDTPATDSDAQSGDDKPANSDSGAIDALAEESAAKLDQQKQSEEDIQKQAELQQLIANKKYNLPIHDAVYGGAGAFTWFINILLIVMVLAAGAVLAHDAGYINIGLDLPFDLIKN